MRDIKIGVAGRIIEGDDVGQHIEVIDDSENTGGFLILQVPDLASNEGYDDWVEDIDSLHIYFDESNWNIEWDNKTLKELQKAMNG